MINKQEFINALDEYIRDGKKYNQIAEDIRAFTEDCNLKVDSVRPEEEQVLIQKLLDLLLDFKEINEKIADFQLPRVTDNAPVV